MHILWAARSAASWAAAFFVTLVFAMGCSTEPEGQTGDGDGDGVAPDGCVGGQLSCAGICTDASLDNLNCGACGNQCVPGSRCAAGGCACTAAGFTPCADACLDTASDPNNCGGCGVACDAAQQCLTGACTCRAETTLCGASCVQVQSDPLNCGGCGVACDAALVCSLGTCTDTCAAGLMQCGQSCTDTNADFANCGACGNACGAGQDCVAGACTCPAGQELCGGTCVDVTSSNLNCGACGNTCAPGASCEAGACSCAAGETDCSGMCVNTQSNATHCGACEVACAAGQTCEAGVCTGEVDDTGCADGLTDCDGTCVDLQAVSTDCGSCGNDCDGLQCVEGTCQAVKLCAEKTVIAEPTIATFEGYDGTMPVSDWGFAFNAPAGDAAAVYSGLYTFSDGVGDHALSMSTGNQSSYAARVQNTMPGGAGAWGGTVALWMGCIDASAYTGLSVYVKGPVPSGTVSLALSMEETSAPDEDNPDAGGTCLSECTEASVEISVTDEWSQVIIPWSEFTPGTANATTIPVTGNNITGISFSVQLAYVEDPSNPGEYIPDTTPYDFSFDDVVLTTGGESCPSDQALCGTACIDTQTNPAHCGACESACPEGLSCSGGSCNCGGGLTACDEECVDTQTNVYHCGACGERCLGTCSGGSCTINSCGAVDTTPFDCDFAWGANDNSSSYLDISTTWVGYEVHQGRPGDCDGCGLVSDVAGQGTIPAFYAYFIGYSLPDCNVSNSNNLCQNGAQYIRDNRSQIISWYADYAQQAYNTNPNKPVAWLLEGDFIQYTYDEQNNPLSYGELGSLATDIVCAIKGAAPNALVSINHSPWITNDQANAFWDAMPLDSIDFVWTTGTGTNNGYINDGIDSSEYNAATARYDWLHQKTTLGVFVDTSFGPSQQADSWSSASAAQLNSRISEGVIAANVTQPPDDYQSRINTLNSQLNSTCQ